MLYDCPKESSRKYVTQPIFLMKYATWQILLKCACQWYSSRPIRPTSQEPLFKYLELYYFGYTFFSKKENQCEKIGQSV